MSIKSRIEKLEARRRGAVVKVQALRQRAMLAVAKAYAGQGCDDLAEVVLQHDQQTGDHLAERIKKIYGGHHE